MRGVSCLKSLLLIIILPCEMFYKRRRQSTRINPRRTLTLWTEHHFVARYKVFELRTCVSGLASMLQPQDSPGMDKKWRHSCTVQLLSHKAAPQETTALVHS